MAKVPAICLTVCAAAAFVLCRERIGAPGMVVLQFAWGGGTNNVHLPHMHYENSFCYPGTHDNETAVGWFADSANAQDKKYLKAYLGSDGKDIAWDFIKAAMASVSKTSVILMQVGAGLCGMLGQGYSATCAATLLCRADWQRVSSLTGSGAAAGNQEYGVSRVAPLSVAVAVSSTVCRPQLGKSTASAHTRVKHQIMRYLFWAQQLL